MLTKESTLKDLVDEVTLNWFRELVNERIKRMRVEIEEIAKQMPMFLQMGGANGSEFESHLQQAQNEIKVLKNFNEIQIYTKTNGFDTNEAIFKDGEISFEAMAKFLQKGESVSKMLIKLQLGETFAVTFQILEKIMVLDTKIGFEELIKEIDSEDIDYLLKKSLNQWEQEILTFIAKNPTDSENVLEEIRELISTNDWEVKLKNGEIIERYFSKFKVNNLLGSFTSPEDFQDKSSQEQIINYSRVVSSIHSLIFLIKLSKNLLEEFKKIT